MVTWRENRTLKSSQKVQKLNKNKLTKKQKIHTMKLLNIAAIALGTLTTTSEAV